MGINLSLSAPLGYGPLRFFEISESVSLRTGSQCSAVPPLELILLF